MPICARTSCLILCAVLVACGSDATIQRERARWTIIEVVDGRQQPISEAAIAFVEYGTVSGWVDSSSYQLFQALSFSDGSGQFSFPKIGRKRLLPTVYRSGYTMAKQSKGTNGFMVDDERRTIQMVRINDRSGRLAAIRQAYGLTRTPIVESGARDAVRWYDILIADLRALDQDDESRKLLLELKRWRDSNEEVAGRPHRQ